MAPRPPGPLDVELIEQIRAAASTMQQEAPKVKKKIKFEDTLEETAAQLDKTARRLSRIARRR